MKLAAELDVRKQPSDVGGDLIIHFPEFLEHRIRCFSVQASAMLSLWDREGRKTLRTELKMCNAIGVIPQSVAAFTVDDFDDDAAGEAELNTPVSSSTADIVLHSGSASGSSSSGDLATVRERLGSLYSEQRGPVTHRYTGEGMLAYASLNSVSSNSASAVDALAASAIILFGGAPGIDLAADIKTKKFCFPSANVLHSARVRLDLMDILFQRLMFLRFEPCHYLIIP